LLVPAALKGKKELEVRQNAKRVWVEGAEEKEVFSFE
jgi:hypothetical protein